MRASLLFDPRSCGGTTTFDRISDRLDEAWRDTDRIVKWLPGWRAAADQQRAIHEPAFQVFRMCLPALVLCADIYNWSLVLLLLGQEDDAALGEQAISEAEAVAPPALGFIGDTPALRHKHATLVSTVLSNLEQRGRTLRELSPQIQARLGELRKDRQV